jgi:Flp pilus assembly protein TadD
MPTFARARLPALAAAGCCALCALWLGVNAIDARRVHEANDLGLRGDSAGALVKAAGVTRAPARVRALRTQAYAAALLNRLGEADRALVEAIDAAPNDWSAHRDRAAVLQHLGRVDEAADEMRRAAALNPRIVPPAGFVLEARR